MQNPLKMWITKHLFPSDIIGDNIAGMTDVPKGSFICKDCLSVSKPVKISTDNPSLNTAATVGMFRQYGLVRGGIFAALAHSKKPLGCAVCKSTNVIPVETPMGQILLSQLKEKGD